MTVGHRPVPDHLRCDVCGRVYDAERIGGDVTALTLRRDAGQADWMCFDRQDVDLCPDCRLSAP